MADAPHDSSSIARTLAPALRLAPIDRIDPRARIVAATVFSLLAAVVNGSAALGLALAVALAAAAAAPLRPRDVLRRLAPVNLFMLLLLLFLPWSTAGTPLVSIGPIRYTREGLAMAVGIALKGNAIVLVLVALLGTQDLVTLGHALRHLRVPEKLIHLLLFTVRYLDVLDREYGRLRGAMKMRGFRPRMDGHTYRSYGHLVGMLLVRSLDRSDRIVAAMKCRGFRGRFYLLDHFAYSGRDGWFAATSLAVLAAMAWLEWS